MGLVKAGIAAAIAMLVAAPTAGAAYAPKLAITIDPATPSAPAAITSKVTQASGETASKTVKVTFPAGFTPNPKAKVTPCSPDQEQADSCPPASQVGTALAQTQLGPLNGPVFFEVNRSQLELVVYLKGFGGLISQKLIATITVVNGRLQTTFDNLPNTPTTAFELDLQGGDKALSLTPAKCGLGTFDAAFTSQNDEQATGQAKVDIEGCPTTPTVSAVSVSPRAFKAVRKFSDTQRPGFGTTLDWTLSEATGGTRITVQKRVKGHWRRAGSFLGTGSQGRNELKWDGRLRKKPLAAGAYRFVLQTTSRAGLPSASATAAFAIRV